MIEVSNFAMQTSKHLIALKIENSKSLKLLPKLVRFFLKIYSRSKKDNYI